ncbi:hypothetical protein B9Z55_014896 [Caenorhabditis nigoni]|uniref:Fibronectin type-III domain-containing protein n=2 Tax=Caenorhabditis nigoni TaxID=1611254 RepID=A0A2G5U7Z4_9PELO|nr:hypothetical protein B9Z55_014896 [Caenorhabditis nigoni]
MDEEHPLEMETFDQKNESLPEESLRKLVRWRPVQNVGGSMPRARHGHRAVSVKDLIIIFGGGNEGMIDELHVFNPQKREWYVPQIRGQSPSPAAAFGATALGTKIYTFGGMIEYGKYTSEVYELQATRWEWRRMPTKTSGSDLAPAARLGHSFVASQKTQKAYMFGGLTNELNDSKRNLPRYMNDLYTLDLSAAPNAVIWEKPETFGEAPSVRESHTAVIYETDTVNRMIIYGGMNGVRLGDLWYLDLDTMHWTEIKLDDPRCGISPEPRSLHTSVLIDDKMFVYGGWVPLMSSGPGNEQEREWKCTSSVACWDITKNQWIPLQHYCSDPETMPRGRAGHCAAAMGDRMFIWSGRDGYRKAWSNQVCCRDMWELETKKPEQPGKISLARAGFNLLEVSWPPVPGATAYFLQTGFVDTKDGPASEKRVPPSPRKQPSVAAAVSQKEDEKNAPAAPSLISTQGTTYTAPAPPNPTANEGELPQDLFDDAEKNERTSASPKPSGDSQAGVSTKKPDEGASQSDEGTEKEEEASNLENEDDDLAWFDIGVIKDPAVNVTHYFHARQPPLEDQIRDLIDKNGFKCVNDPCFTADDKVPLINGHTYRFRVCAVNGLGKGAWSETQSFKTCTPGYPSAPSSIRITKSPDGAQLTWEPPANTHVSGKILEYSVYLAVKNQSANPADSQLAFMRVYCGPLAECNVHQPSLQSAYVDHTNKPAIIFRIAAKNEKGYGPATQVRWLQDQQKMMPVRSAYPNMNPGYAYQNQAPQQKRIRYDHH